MGATSVVSLELGNTANFEFGFNDVTTTVIQ